MSLITARKRIKQRRAYVAWLSGDRHQFTVPLHHHLYADGDDYVIGCYRTRSEVWRRPKNTIAVAQLRDELVWLM
jgi:hypothetical protein